MAINLGERYDVSMDECSGPDTFKWRSADGLGNWTDDMPFDESVPMSERVKAKLLGQLTDNMCIKFFASKEHLDGIDHETTTDKCKGEWRITAV